MTELSMRKAIGYAALPGIFPRVKSLFFSGFGNIAYIVALIYSLVRLLPTNHPYLNSNNIGKYGVIHVLAAAWRNLTFRWQNIDQIIVYFAILAGTGGMILFIVGLLAFIIVSPVAAGSYFSTPSPATDVAFLMLDKALGIPATSGAGSFFGSEVGSNVAKYGAFPSPFHIGLNALWQFYSMGLFLLTMMVFIYYIAVIVVETSITGTPFGRRFDNIWVPFRMVVALGLLMPGFGGLSSAQYIVLYAAKYGSGLASNAWFTYNLNAGDNPLGAPNRELVTRPAIPDYTGLIKDLLLVRGCMDMFIESPEVMGTAEYMVKGDQALPVLTYPTTWWPTVPPRSPRVDVIIGGVPFIPQYKSSTDLNTYDGTVDAGDSSFTAALDFYGGDDIHIVLGTHDPVRFEDQPGGVFPYCGEIVIPVMGQTKEALYVAEGYLAAVMRVLYGIPRDTAPGGTIDINERAMAIASARDYYQTSSTWRRYTQLEAAATNKDCFWDRDNNYYDEFEGEEFPQLGDCQGPIPISYYTSVLSRYQEAFKWAPLAGFDYLTGAVTGEDANFSVGDTFYSTVGDPNPILIDQDILKMGWGGAGVWYNRISEKNGALMSAVGAAPSVVRFPWVMEEIKKQRLKADAKVEQNNCEIYNPRRSGDLTIRVPDERNAFSTESSYALYVLCSNLRGNESLGLDPLAWGSRAHKDPNPILNIINSLFGASTFFNLLENRDVHPMAMLSTLGKTLIDKAIFNMVAATGSAVVGGLNQITLGKGDPGFAYITLAASKLSKAFIAFGTIALVAGVVLFYVLPFLPFMYFFFAVGRWVKTIFEAMVGVPLWAIAHLSFKGPGLPSPKASNGYFLILEIFVRPILTVFSLIAAFTVFSAMVVVLNSIFSGLITNIFGASVKLMADAARNPGAVSTEDLSKLSSMRGLFDQLSLTIVYVVLVYLIGTGCFKLIDLIPDNIMRWSGHGVNSFGGSDNADDLVDQTTQYVAFPTYSAFQQIGAGISGVADVSAKYAMEDIQIAQAKAAQQEAAKAGAGGAGAAAAKPQSPAAAPTPSPATPAARPATPSGTGGRPAAGTPASPAAGTGTGTGKPAAPGTPVAPDKSTKLPPGGDPGTPPKKS